MQSKEDKAIQAIASGIGYGLGAFGVGTAAKVVLAAMRLRASQDPSFREDPMAVELFNTLEDGYKIRRVASSGRKILIVEDDGTQWESHLANNEVIKP